MTVSPLKISFIIPVRNGAAYIELCLAHIESQMHPGDEIFVVDNGSTDDTLDIVRGHGNVRVLEYPNLTIAGLRNRGAQEASGEILAFIDSDCLLQQGWRTAVIETLSDSAVQATGSICDLPPSPTWVERAWSASRTDSSRRVEYLPSANLIIRKDAFRAVRGFDESLITDEDYDIGAKITRSGGHVVDSPRVRAIHLGNSKTIPQFIRRQKWHATSILDSLARHGWDKPMIMTLVFMVTCVAALAGLAGIAVYGRIMMFFLGLPLIAPLTSSCYRIKRNGEARYLPHLAVLYLLFYSVRSIALIEGLLGISKRRQV
jgi:glycosyltransferase involved in cell wall biosynthesis